MAILAFPTKYKERGGYIRGAGLNLGGPILFPIADLKALGFQWVRVDYTAGISDYTNAALDEVIAFYMGAGIQMIWTVGASNGTGITSHAFDTPTTRAQQIIGRWQAAGYRACMLELGNENVQQHIPAGGKPMVFTVSSAISNPLVNATYTNNGQTFTVLLGSISAGSGTVSMKLATGDPSASGTLTKATGSGPATMTYTSVDYHFSTEALCEAAYATALNNFYTAMAGYDFICLGVNDESAYVKKAFDVIAAAGGSMPDGWGFHGYAASSGGVQGSNMPGTIQTVQELTGGTSPGTEMNYTAPTVSAADAAAYFQNMTTNMGDLPWCYYTGGDNGYNSATDGYGLYTHQYSQGVNGVSAFDTRSTTLTTIASNMGITLP